MSDGLSGIVIDRIRSATLATLLLAASANAQEADEGERQPGKLREFLTKDRNWFIAPVPVSTPTFGTGLLLGGAWFWEQTEAQKVSQPASVTGAAGFISDNDSKAFGIGHLGYFNDDKWRLGGLAGYVDLNLDLRTAGVGGSPGSIDWLVKGGGFGGQVMREVRKDWYLGLTARYVDIEQTFAFELPAADLNVDSNTQSIGLGAKVEYDTRDNQFNPYTGREFRISVLANSESIGSDLTYESYSAAFSSYHPVFRNAVVAWEVQGCYRSGSTPLWDACFIDLRGFNTTEYIGLRSASAQAEFRWRFHRRWGAVAFMGGGYYTDSFSGRRENDLIPSYGTGIRFLILESQRINVRVDYARSRDDDAWYLGVAETF